MYLLGYDIGSSSVKASLLDAASGKAVGTAFSPKKEMEILAAKPGWAEQHPGVWWDNLVLATKEVLAKHSVISQDIKAIGISYQMHGLVAVDKNLEVVRPSIIWCDSRAVGIGNRAFDAIGHKKCFEHFLNSPGNFTASKLKWVMENEPEVYSKIHKIMLPGDYIAMKMTGEVNTTSTGLSEGILWDYKEGGIAEVLLNHYSISPSLLPQLTEVFGIQGTLSSKAASELSLPTGIPITYRAGDQANNAFSLNVLQPGEVASTAGTSGVIYGVSQETKYDENSRVNTFVHVNHTRDNPRYGVLLCINGTGILNSWLKNNLLGKESVSYDQMNELASQVSVGSKGLVILPFGNGAERVLGNKDVGAQILNLRFNTHNKSHILRAAQEGIVFALKYGLDVMKTVGVQANKIKAGKANMFLSPVFSKAFATITEATIEFYNTDGAQGAARAAGVGVGIYKNQSEAFIGLESLSLVEPDTALKAQYEEAYGIWLNALNNLLLK